jgi:hypothetical protein
LNPNPFLTQWNKFRDLRMVGPECQGVLRQNKVFRLNQVMAPVQNGKHEVAGFSGHQAYP